MAKTDTTYDDLGLGIVSDLNRFIISPLLGLKPNKAIKRN